MNLFKLMPFISTSKTENDTAYAINLNHNATKTEQNKGGHYEKI